MCLCACLCAYLCDFSIQEPGKLIKCNLNHGNLPMQSLSDEKWKNEKWKNENIQYILSLFHFFPLNISIICSADYIYIR